MTSNWDIGHQFGRQGTRSQADVTCQDFASILSPSLRAEARFPEPQPNVHKPEEKNPRVTALWAKPIPI